MEGPSGNRPIDGCNVGSYQGGGCPKASLKKSGGERVDPRSGKHWYPLRIRGGQRVFFGHPARLSHCDQVKAAAISKDYLCISNRRRNPKQKKRRIRHGISTHPGGFESRDGRSGLPGEGDEG